MGERVSSIAATPPTLRIEYPLVSALLATLHHLAAFTLVAALAVEVALFKLPLSAYHARRLQRTDLIFGIAAGVLLLVGLVRVTWFEKGPSYYWHDVFFLTKFGAFLAAALFSLYPTRLFLSWNRRLQAGEAPEIDRATFRRARLCMMLELTAIVVILPCAALMARGYGVLH
jgi:putative membrane protein